MSQRTAHILDEKWRSDDIKSGENADFSSLFLSKELLRGLTAAGYKHPSPIQLKAIPVGKIGKDLIVQAKSGTGKTLVFSVVALNMLLKGAKHPQVLIMAPTREIACQICQVIKCIAVPFKDFACEYFIGGRKLEEDIPRIQGCQVIVGTPGRIKQMISCKILKTAGIRLFVLDEADQLLKESSFTNDIDDIFRALPRDKQMIATSATYPNKLKRLINKYFREPLLMRLNKDDIGLLGMVHYYRVIPVSKLPVVAYKKKLQFLEEVLMNVKFAQCLVFCNMVSRVENLCVEIKNWGFATSFISGAREQQDRLKAIELLKKFKCKVLVSSDVSSRGIDAENVDLVINFDLPAFLDTYFHRVGRAGRYGSKCASITFITSDEIDAYQQMQETGKFQSFPLPDHVPSGLISMQPKRKCIKKEDESLSGDETESSSDSSLDSEEEQEKTNGFSNGSCSSKVEKIIFENLVNSSNEKLVDSEENIESIVSNGIQNQSDDSNSTSGSSAKENDNFSSASESGELALGNTNSLASDELKQQGEGIEVHPSTEIVVVEKENELNANESIEEESFENAKLVRKLSSQDNSVAFEENIENCQSDKYTDNINELKQTVNTSSYLADVESFCEKTVDGKSLVVNKDPIISKILNNPKTNEFFSSVTTFITEYENQNNEVKNCVTAGSANSSPTLHIEPSNEKFSAGSLAHLRSNLSKYQYNVCTNFLRDISDDKINKITTGCEKESVNQVTEIRDQRCLKENDDGNKIKCSSSLDSRQVLFSTPKVVVNSGSNSGHSSGQESGSGSDMDKLVIWFNPMVGNIDKIEPSNDNFASESSSELNSDASVNSENAMYWLTKEFNKVTHKGASGSKKGTNKHTKKSNIIHHSELSSSSDSSSGISVDSENAANELDKEFTNLMKAQKSEKSPCKINNKTRKILHKIKGMKKCFEGIEIADVQKHSMSSSNSTSDSDYSDTRKHAESFKDSSTDSVVSADINKRNRVAGSTKASKSSSNMKKTKNAAAQNVGKNSKQSPSGSRKIQKKGKKLRAETIKGPIENKITHYYSDASSPETESDIDQYSKQSPSGSRKIHKKGKTLRAETIKGPIENKITYYYSDASSSETESGMDQHSMESQSGLLDGHRRKMETHKKDRTQPKTRPSHFNYSNTNGTSFPNLNTAVKRQFFNPARSYDQMQPTSYAATNPNHQMQPTNYAASNPNYQMQPTSYATTNPNDQMQQTNYAATNPYYQLYPQQVQSHANYGLFPGTESGRQMERTSYTSNLYYQPYPSECQQMESCQMINSQPSVSGHSAGNVQSNYLHQNYAYNQCCVPSQHPCHPPNETCQSPACAAWYDIFYQQWQFLNKSPYF